MRRSVLVWLVVAACSEDRSGPSSARCVEVFNHLDELGSFDRTPDLSDLADAFRTRCPVVVHSDEARCLLAASTPEAADRCLDREQLRCLLVGTDDAPHPGDRTWCAEHGSTVAEIVEPQRRTAAEQADAVAARQAQLDVLTNQLGDLEAQRDAITTMLDADTQALTAASTADERLSAAQQLAATRRKQHTVAQKASETQQQIAAIQACLASPTACQ